MLRFSVVLIAALITLGSTAALAQHGPNDIPNWNRDENYTDKQKLKLLTRKAHYEQERAANFASRGIKGYEPSKDSVRIAMPTTAKSGNRRLEQLNRIRKHADKATGVWINWEFDVIRKRTIWLINNGR